MDYQNWRKPWSILIAIALCATGLRAATPDPTNSPPLNSWSFENVESWDSDAGYSPLSWTNITSFQTNGINCLIIDSTNNAYLSYNVVENNGTTNAFTNITVDAGSILFWVAPS